MSKTSSAQSAMPAEPDALLRQLPSVDAVLRHDDAQALLTRMSHERLAAHARRAVAELRDELQNGEIANDPRAAHVEQQDAEANTLEASRASLLAGAALRLQRLAHADDAPSLRRVINATGVILHTNLGRAPLSAEARRRVAEEAGGYCTLEYDLTCGLRGRRAPRVEELLTEITGAEAACIVNNGAAATLLVLAALAADGETIISRGELVEIGGDFRIPDVMRASGTRMIEVGTTNRTRTGDYEAAITTHTRLICHVHPSNFRVIGFTAGASIAELAALAHERNLPLYEDAGSGLLYDLSAMGLTGEPVIPQSVRDGADVVSFSGDKLLGGSQAGIIIGRRDLVERIRRTPLARALRADKLALAALEATLEAHRRGTAHTEVPALAMLSQTYAETEDRAAAFLRTLRDRSIISDASTASDASPLAAAIVADEAAIGGGSAPLTRLPTAAIALTHRTLPAARIMSMLRRAAPPVIARIVCDRVLLNLRTVAATDEAELCDALRTLANA